MKIAQNSKNEFSFNDRLLKTRPNSNMKVNKKFEDVNKKRIQSAYTRLNSNNKILADKKLQIETLLSPSNYNFTKNKHA